jgi:hypothetical protein
MTCCEFFPKKITLAKEEHREMEMMSLHSLIGIVHVICGADMVLLNAYEYSVYEMLQQYLLGRSRKDPHSPQGGNCRPEGRQNCF